MYRKEAQKEFHSFDFVVFLYVTSIYFKGKIFFFERHLLKCDRNANSDEWHYSRTIRTLVNKKNEDTEEQTNSRKQKRQRSQSEQMTDCSTQNKPQLQSNLKGATQTWTRD